MLQSHSEYRVQAVYEQDKVSSLSAPQGHTIVSLRSHLAIEAQRIPQTNTDSAGPFKPLAKKSHQMLKTQSKKSVRINSL
jgi:hypothetical protein